MPSPTAPVKTPLGQDELRHRTRGLGQRYRTVLLLVDGNRPLGEVLGMAHKAGAQTSHLEELVRMGLVELPLEAAAPVPHQTPVEADALEPIALAPMAHSPPEPGDRADPVGLPGPAAAQLGSAEPGAEPGAEPISQVAEVDQGVAPALPVIEVSAQAPPSRLAPPQPAPSAPLRPMSEEHLLQTVRELLLDTLRRDSLLLPTFAASRVRRAQTQHELIELVWEIERDRAHDGRTRSQLLKLQRARELLGMGNTLVEAESQSGPPSRQ